MTTTFDNLSVQGVDCHANKQVEAKYVGLENFDANSLTNFSGVG